MISIKDNVITITRGDSLETKIGIKTSDGEDYIPADGDVIRFALKSSYKDKEPLIYKEINHDSMSLILDAEDTKKLSARAKEYVYDVQINFADGRVDTFIDRGKLYVTDEVD